MEINLDEYRRLRDLIRRHHSAVVETLPRATLLKCAKMFGLLRKNKLLLESESELTILMDYCIYTHRQRGRSLMDLYLAKLVTTNDPADQEIAEAMLKARFSIFKFQQVHPGRGVTVVDLVRGDSLLLVDEALSRSMAKGSVLATRVLPFPSFWVTTGAGFPISEDVLWLVMKVLVNQFLLTEGDLSHLSVEADAELATTVIGAAFKEKTTASVSYIKPGTTGEP
jgi:hypothetical protein